MQDTDAKSFERAILRLCAAFDVPLTDARREAYWRSFRKVSVLEFAGLIDAALIESTFASMPTVGALWELHRKLQPSNPRPEKRRGPSIQEQLCDYAASKLKRLIASNATLDQRWIYARPWTYVYREWMAEGKQCAECIGIVIEIDNKKLEISVSNMQADEAGVSQLQTGHKNQTGDVAQPAA